MSSRAVLEQARLWNEAGEIASILSEIPRIFVEVLDVIRATSGALNFNDAVLVVLQQQSVIGDVASFDEAFDHVAGFCRLI